MGDCPSRLPYPKLGACRSMKVLLRTDFDEFAVLVGARLARDAQPDPGAVGDRAQFHDFPGRT
jgi:hypothetical protein